MTNLTKDELRHISDAILYSMEILVSRKDELMDIRVRVLEMIDNYCEHDWRKKQYLFHDIYCTKCSKHFEVTK